MADEDVGDGQHNDAKADEDIGDAKAEMKMLEMQKKV